MDLEFQQRTLQQEDGHWWYRGRRQIVHEVIAGLPLPIPARVLDAGCGGGGQLPTLSALGPVVGVEPVAAAAQVARDRRVGEVVEGRVEALPFSDAHFDLVTALDVVEHVDDDRRALSEMRRVTAPEGWLVVTVPAYQWLWSRHDELNHHRRRYTRARLLRAATSAGWRPVRTTYFNSLLLPVAASVRLVDRLRPAQSADVDRTPPVLNDLLERPLLAEAKLLATGRRLPAGLSLLGVFRAPAQPPATAGRIVTSSPSETSVSSPDRKRMSSPPT